MLKKYFSLFRKFSPDELDGYIEYVDRDFEASIVCQLYAPADLELARAEIKSYLIELRDKARHDSVKCDSAKEERVRKKSAEIAARKESIKNQVGIRGLTFVVTGDLKGFGSYDEYGNHDVSDLKEYIEAKGGFLRSAVSGKTDYLICNSPYSTTTKSRRAAELGVPVINENEFLAMAFKTPVDGSDDT